LILAFIFAFCAIAPRPAAAADMTVTLDQAAVIKLPEQVATIVIGNPLIADGSLQPGGTLVITGKGYGTTNIIALDGGGAILTETRIAVRGPRDTVIVYRGIERESYSCRPTCERRITLGDSNAYFEAVMSETGARNGLAAGGGPAPTK